MKSTIIIFILLINSAFAQVSTSTGIVFAKEYSKEISLYRAKAFVIQQILGETNDAVKFDVDPLVASNSGELTTLVYKCDSKSKVGLILGFNTTKWNPAGIVYQEYSFKNMTVKEANEFCENIQIAIKVNADYLEADHDNNNIYLNYTDLTVLVYKSSSGTKMRIFWNGYDAEWELSSFNKTVKRLKKEINKY